MDASEALIAAGFVETVFSCPACGLAGTSLARREAVVGKTCLGCGEAVVVSVLDRFTRSGSRTSGSGA